MPFWFIIWVSVCSVSKTQGLDSLSELRAFLRCCQRPHDLLNSDRAASGSSDRTHVGDNG